MGAFTCTSAVAMNNTAAPPEKPVLVEWFDDHWYKVVREGVTHWLPSVTTKLGVVNKEGLAQWRGDVGNREADLRLYDAQQRGKRIHWAWQVAQQGGAVVYDPWENPVFTPEAIAELKQKHGELAILRTQDEMVQIGKLQRQYEVLKPKVVGIEQTVFDIEQRDAGTVDGIYWVEGGSYAINGKTPLKLDTGIYINDLKTGKYLDDNVWLQLAPYAYMWEKIHGCQIAGALVTHTSARTKSGIQGLATLYRDRATLLGQDYADYRHAAALWEREHKDDQPDQFQFPAIVSLNGGTYAATN